MSEELCCIKKEFRKIDGSGEVMFEKTLEIKGNNLARVVIEFDKRWSDDDENK